MKVTSKGQVTIPIGIRDRLGIFPNSEVDFTEEAGQVGLRKKGDVGCARAAVLHTSRAKRLG